MFNWSKAVNAQYIPGLRLGIADLTGLFITHIQQDMPALRSGSGIKMKI
jgi:hypothetical protein